MNTQAGLPENRKRRVLVSDELALGTSRGAHCSIRASRFRLINANGEETLIPELHLDVVIIRANPKTSKLYFESATYNPTSGAPPACYSDNGVGPSANALQPQHPTCGPCPHNQMNSKINPQTGKGTKACSDRQKLAFIIRGDTAVNVYELQVPPDSLGNLRAYRDFLRSQKDKPDMGEMVTRLSFDPEASHPKLKFEPVDYANDTHTLQMIDYIYDQQLDVAAVGLNDVPADPELVKQAIDMRAQYAQLAPQRGNGMQAPQSQHVQINPPAQQQFQLPPRQEPAVQEAPKNPRGRPRKAPEQITAAPTPQFQPPAPAAPVAAAPGLPDIPEFLRRPAVNAAPPVPPQPAQPQPLLNPQFGMAAAPPPPPQVQEALQAAMRMPPRR